ncbi:hypothetical protein AOA80_09895 [Methanomassiliicoccales archaeon RumEn M1]|nr:hypothetical protein AOA80_09895 [Methanomassiliicoccales archaeon RumEn M1]
MGPLRPFERFQDQDRAHRGRRAGQRAHHQVGEQVAVHGGGQPHHQKGEGQPPEPYEDEHPPLLDHVGEVPPNDVRRDRCQR